MTDPLEQALRRASGSNWRPIGRLGTARVLASQPAGPHWILCWDLPGSRICALVEYDPQFGGLKVVSMTSGPRVSEDDPLPFLQQHAWGTRP